MDGNLRRFTYMWIEILSSLWSAKIRI